MSKRNLAALTLASCLLPAAVAVAQSAAPASGVPWAYVATTTITVKPTAVVEFENLARKINAANVKVGLPPSRFWSVSRGGPGFTYLVTLRYAKWSEMDDRPSMMTVLKKALGDTEGPKVWAAALGSLESVTTGVLRALPALSSPPADLATPPAHIRVTRIQLHQGMGPKFEVLLAKLKAAQDKVGGSPPVIRYATALGQSDEYWAAYFFDKYAQWDGAPGVAEVNRKTYGQAEADVLTDLGRTCIKHLETYVIDYRPDLSQP